jgi:hypothetical protein
MLTVVVQVVTAVLLASAGLLKLRNPAALRSAAVDLGMPSRVTTSGQHRVHFGTEHSQRLHRSVLLARVAVHLA